MSKAGIGSAVRQAAVRVVVPLLVLYAVMVGLGLLITRVWDGHWPLTLEDSVNRQLESERGGTADAVSLVFSTIASTPAIIVVTAVVAFILVVTHRRWQEPVFIIGAVTAQALIFFFTTLVIDRERPAVEHMDVSPPTSSFPSGHTSAAVALYLGMAIVLAANSRSRSMKAAWWALLVSVPIGVALTRMYRGMHHPSDVIGSFINSGTCLLIMARGVLDRGLRWGRAAVRQPTARQRRVRTTVG